MVEPLAHLLGLRNRHIMPCTRKELEHFHGDSICGVRRWGAGTVNSLEFLLMINLRYIDDWCTECLKHPAIQMNILAQTKL